MSISRPANPAPFNPSVRALLGPGPSEVHPRVLRAMATPLLGHLDPEFVAIMDETQDLLRYVFQTRNQMTMAISGTGSAGMEAMVVNLIEPGDKMLVCVKGYFGERLAEVARRAGAAVSIIERPYGEVFDPQEVRDAVRRERPKVVGIVHAETSTGAWQPIQEIAGIAHEHGALIAIDCVTSLGGVEVDIDGWNIDAAFSGTQKCLGGPPGLAPITFGPRALEVIKQRKHPIQSWYLDATKLGTYWGSERAYHHTAPISTNFAFREALALVVEEGLEARIARHKLNSDAFKAGVKAMGLSLCTAAGHELPQLTAVRVPDGIDDLTVRKRLLNEWGIEVGSGLGIFKGKAWRIGLMGYGSRKANVTLLLAALETCLRDLGFKLQPGAGLSAAAACYASRPAG